LKLNGRMGRMVDDLLSYWLDTLIGLTLTRVIGDFDHACAATGRGAVVSLRSPI
jgi:hypothetical protein